MRSPQAGPAAGLAETQGWNEGKTERANAVVALRRDQRRNATRQDGGAATIAGIEDVTLVEAAAVKPPCGCTISRIFNIKPPPHRCFASDGRVLFIDFAK